VGGAEGLASLVAALALAAALAADLPPVERASADDCAVIVAIGRAELGWSDRSPPDPDFFGEYDRPGGGTYMQACDWRRFGVLAPRVGGPPSQRGFSISRPNYAGGKATATLDVFVRAQNQTLAPFRMQKHCEVTRRGRAWVLVACRQGLIT
jgi:hypothetical protein